MTADDVRYETDEPIVEDPEWLSDSDHALMTAVDDPNDQAAPELRTSTGAIDFLQGVFEEFRSFLELDRLEPEQRDVPNKAISIKECPAQKWRGRTATVTDTSTLLVAESKQRRRITIHNLSAANNVYVSSISGVGSGRPNQFILQPVLATAYPPPLIIESTDDIYVMCAPTLTAIITYIEEFDL